MLSSTVWRSISAIRAVTRGELSILMGISVKMSFHVIPESYNCFAVSYMHVGAVSEAA